MDQRRFLSVLTGQKDLATKKFFIGVFTIDTLPMATNLSDLNKSNFFFVNIDSHFITIFNSTTHCFVIDGVSINSYPDALRKFVDSLRGEIPVTTLPFKMIKRDSSLVFSIFCAVFLCQGSTNLKDSISSLGLRRNSVVSNAEILTVWFKKRYNFQ